MSLQLDIKEGELAKVFLSKNSSDNIFFRDRFNTKETVIGAVKNYPPEFKSMVPIKSGEYVLVLEQKDAYCKVLYNDKIFYISQKYLVDERHSLDE